MKAYVTEFAIFALKQTVDFSRNHDTHVYMMCFRDAKKAVDRVNYWTLPNKLFDSNVPLHVGKLILYWCREKEFLVQ